jgi:hypothetical protein
MAQYCRTFTPDEEAKIVAYLAYAASTAMQGQLLGIPQVATIQEWFDAVLDAAMIAVNHPRQSGSL